MMIFFIWTVTGIFLSSKIGTYSTILDNISVEIQIFHTKCPRVIIGKVSIVDLRDTS